MSKDVLETLLILDFKAQGRGRRFQYATYGPPAPEGGRTIKQYAVRIAPATQAATGPEGSAPPATLVLPQYGAYFCSSSMLEPLKRYGINPKTRSRDGFAVKLQPYSLLRSAGYCRRSNMIRQGEEGRVREKGCGFVLILEGIGVTYRPF